MSLLLDALKRAEQEKLARNGERPSAPEPPSRSSPGSTAASLELQPLASGAPPPPASARGDAAAAQAMFAAKSPREVASQKKRGVLYAILAVVAILLIAAIAYVWHSVSALMLPPPTPMRVRPPAAPTPAPASGAPAAFPNPPSTTAKVEPFVPMAIPPARQPQDATFEPLQPKARAGAAHPEKPLSQLLREAPASPQEPPLKLARSDQRPRVAPQVTTGYEALRSGDLVGARQSYAAALAADSLNTDALLGLATVEARSGNRAAAAINYRRALEIDPRNATALAGLAALADFSRPEALESQLRGDLSRNPQSPALLFTLGNVYAAQSRWSEAQTAYFEAHRLDPGNADILYNLAVSLDHLNQPRLAADFYRRTLDTARGQVTQFDPSAVARRIAELKP